MTSFGPDSLADHQVDGGTVEVESFDNRIGVVDAAAQPLRLVQGGRSVLPLQRNAHHLAPGQGGPPAANHQQQPLPQGSSPSYCHAQAAASYAGPARSGATVR